MAQHLVGLVFSWLGPLAFIGASFVYYSVFGNYLDGLLLLNALFWQDRSWVPLKGGDACHTSWAVAAFALIAATTLASVCWWQRAAVAESRPLPSRSGPGRVLFYPCTTTHARLLPVKHSFTSSHLVVGLPVSWEGTAGRLVSAGPQTSFWQRKAWFHVDPKDHLGRDAGHPSLRRKLDTYLQSQGVDPSNYPHAYLVTTARFLDYQYNPVSFWYLYNGNRALAAVIVEVNNPFGERHLYYLPAGSRPKKLTDSVVPGAGDSKAASFSARFSQTWAKNFHVSPFNSRKGSYSITALDPATADAQGLGPIDTTIVLRSSHGHEKIVARLFSAGPAVDPFELTAWQAVRFVVTWWVGLATFSRMLKEAGALFFQKKLHIWLRPEPLRESVSRLANGAERRLETAFRCYLHHLVEEQAASAASTLRPLAVTYIPCGIPEAATERILSPAAAGQRDGDVDEVEIKVLTPVFYARFVGYAHDVEALFCELRESCTVDVSQPELLAKLVLTRVPRPPLQVTGAVDFLFFKAIQKLRRRPERLESPMIWPRGKLSAASAVPASHTSTGDLRGFRLSAMDGFVLSLQGASGHDTRRSYRAAVLALFLADRMALGSYRVFLAQCLSVRLLVAWAVAGTVSTLRSHAGQDMQAAVGWLIK